MGTKANITGANTAVINKEIYCRCKYSVQHFELSESYIIYVGLRSGSRPAESFELNYLIQRFSKLIIHIGSRARVRKKDAESVSFTHIMFVVTDEFTTQIFK